MINEFEVKMTLDSNWELKFINIFRGISISNNETDYRNHIRTKLNGINVFSIDEKKSKEGYKYFILTIKSTQYTVQIRAISRISLEYFIYHSIQKDPVDIGRPLTFYPHLSNFESPLVDKNLTQNNYQGFFNLILLALLLTHLRLIMDNFKKYGTILTPTYMFSIVSNYKNSLFIILSALLVSIVTVLAYSIERLASRTSKAKLANVLRIINISSLVIIPLYFHRWNLITPISGAIGLSIIVSFSMKLISYAHFWSDVRRFIDNKARLFSKDKSLMNLQGDIYKDILEVIDHYPNNITLRRLISFMFKPVLCYQYKYPKSARIRKRYVAYYGLQVIFFLFLFSFINVQYTLLSVEHTLEHFESMNYIGLAQRILVIAIPNLYSWIILFYAFFHCWLNFLAELTRFADRRFYSDWWNSLYLDEYWRKWNITTHYWLIRHIYNPLRRRKFGKLFCAGATFAFSGLFHEYVLSGALGLWSYWGFLAMFSNFPLSLIQIYIRESKKYAWCKDSQLWNVLFWVMFCFIGQPIGFVLYFYNYIKLNYPQNIPQ